MAITLLTGGGGKLGKELISLDKNIFAPTRNEFNLFNVEQMKKYINEKKIELIIHAAAYTDVVESEKQPELAIQTNVIGTINILSICREKNIKLVYISTDYVFDGKKGMYKKDDPINPLSCYAKTKAAAELLVRTYKNSLIIRTSFFGRVFPYKKAFVDQYTSKDYVDLQAPRILNICKKNITGILNVGAERRSVYEIAVLRNPSILPAYLKDAEIIIPQDTSLEIDE